MELPVFVEQKAIFMEWYFDICQIFFTFLRIMIRTDSNMDPLIQKKGSKLKKKIHCNFFQLAWIRIWVSHNTWIQNTSRNYGRYNIYINSDLIAQATSTRKAKNGIFFNWLIIYTYFLIKTKLRSIRYLFKYGMNAKEIEGESEWRFQDYSLF